MSPRRMWAVVLVLLAGGVTVVARAVQVSVLEGPRWRERAERQHEQHLEVPGPRGSIRSADGYVLATSLDRAAIQADTRLLDDPEIFARAAAPILGADVDDLLDRLQRGPRTVWIGKRVDPAVAESVRELAPTAIVLVPDFARVYPLGSLAAPVIGFVGHEELLAVGRAGLEHLYDESLAAEPRIYLAINDAVQRKVRLERLAGGRDGSDLELTLHARLQAVAERELEQAVAALQADAASAVVVDPHTGELLVLASVPSFDPAAPGLVSPDRWRLRPVQDAIEPGSTVKPLVAAAALSAGAVRRGERFDCTDRGTRIAGFWIRDHVEPGRYTLDEVVAHSANTGIIAVAERLSPEHLYRTFTAFGFGRRSEIDFPAEARGLVPEVESWSALSRAGFALGQELTVTPLQMALAYAAIANGGWLPEPCLVAHSNGRERSLPGDHPLRARVLDTALASRLTAMLEAVVEEGTGDGARVPGYRVAGKTGTAQRAVNGRFDDEHHVAWFAGFLPLPDPRVVVVVAIENPRVDFWASTAAAPVFARIAGAAVRHLDVPPDVPSLQDGLLLARTTAGDAAVGGGA